MYTPIIGDFVECISDKGLRLNELSIGMTYVVSDIVGDGVKVRIQGKSPGFSPMASRFKLLKRDSKWDTSGFDALRSAGKDDSVDAMGYAKHAMQGSFDISKGEAIAMGRKFHEAYPGMSEYCKTDVEIADKMLRHAKNYGRGITRMTEEQMKLNKKMEGNTMSITINTLVAKNTDNIKDAELVTKYFGDELCEHSIKDELFVEANYDELLKRAKAEEEKKIADLAKSCA